MDEKKYLGQIEELEDKIEEMANDKSVYQKADDWFGEHNVFSRLIILSAIFVLVYAFIAGNVALAEIAALLIIGIFVLVSVGINSLKIVAEVIVKIRGKK